MIPKSVEENGKLQLEKLGDAIAHKGSESTGTPCYIKISMADLCHMYAAAYHAGHHDTVEGNYTDVYPCDMDTYHEETVTEFLEELKE